MRACTLCPRESLLWTRTVNDGHRAGGAGRVLLGEGDGAATAEAVAAVQGARRQLVPLKQHRPLRAAPPARSHPWSTEKPLIESQRLPQVSYKLERI